MCACVFVGMHMSMLSVRMSVCLSVCVCVRVCVCMCPCFFVRVSECVVTHSNLLEDVDTCCIAMSSPVLK
jgi:hypothetical protein